MSNIDKAPTSAPSSKKSPRRAIALLGVFAGVIGISAYQCGSNEEPVSEKKTADVDPKVETKSREVLTPKTLLSGSEDTESWIEQGDVGAKEIANESDSTSDVQDGLEECQGLLGEIALKDEVLLMEYLGTLHEQVRSQVLEALAQGCVPEMAMYPADEELGEAQKSELRFRSPAIYQSCENNNFIFYQEEDVSPEVVSADKVYSDLTQNEMQTLEWCSDYHSELSTKSAEEMIDGLLDEGADEIYDKIQPLIESGCSFNENGFTSPPEPYDRCADYVIDLKERGGIGAIDFKDFKKMSFPDQEAYKLLVNGDYDGAIERVDFDLIERDYDLLRSMAHDKKYGLSQAEINQIEESCDAFLKSAKAFKLNPTPQTACAFQEAWEGIDEFEIYGGAVVLLEALLGKLGKIEC